MTAALHHSRASAGMLLALIMLFVQAVVLPMPQDANAGKLAALLGPQVICHINDALGVPDRQAPSGHGHDCVLCPVCQIATAPALIQPSAAILPSPNLVDTAHAAPLPLPTAPPRLVRYATSPRGPPASAV